MERRKFTYGTHLSYSKACPVLYRLTLFQQVRKTMLCVSILFHSSKSVSLEFSLQLSADPCTSDPCLHGNCTHEGTEFVCVCSDGYGGVRCEQPPSAFDLVESNWDLAATPATTTQPSQPITELSDTEAPPTLQPWQPKPGQKMMEVQWEELQVCAYIQQSYPSSANEVL